MKNQLNQISINQLVKAEDKRRFRQNLESKLKIQLEIKAKDQSSDLYLPGVATWPHPGLENVAKAAFSWLC